MLKSQQSTSVAKTTVARDRARTTLPFSELFSALENECEAKLAALDAASDARIVEIQAQADQEIRKIQAIADAKIKKVLVETMDEAAKIINRMRKRLNKVATRTIGRMSSEDLAILVAASIEAENERAQEAEQKVVADKESLENFRKQNLERAQQIMSDQKPTSCYDPEGMD